MTHQTAGRLDILAAGLRWLYDTEQPDGALLSHHGSMLPSSGRNFPVEGNRIYSFVPAGAAGRPVVAVEVAHVDWVGPRDDKRPANPLEPTELDDLAAVLAALGAEVADTWNGHPGITGSLGLKRPAHPSLLAAVNRYRAGCLEHPRKLVFCQCGWYQAGNALVVPPTAAVPAQGV